MSGIKERESGTTDHAFTAEDVMRARGATQKEIDAYRKRQMDRIFGKKAKG